MTAQETRNRIAFEMALRTGDVVEVRWTSCYSYYAAQAEVVSVNKSSISCKLLENVNTWRGQLGWAEGQRLSFPRFPGKKWSANNGVFVAA